LRVLRTYRYLILPDVPAAFARTLDKKRSGTITPIAHNRLVVGRVLPGGESKAYIVVEAHTVSCRSTRLISVRLLTSPIRTIEPDMTTNKATFRGAIVSITILLVSGKKAAAFTASEMLSHCGVLVHAVPSSARQRDNAERAGSTTPPTRPVSSQNIGAVQPDCLAVGVIV
jgi:hypothetical protein